MTGTAWGRGGRGPIVWQSGRRPVRARRAGAGGRDRHTHTHTATGGSCLCRFGCEGGPVGGGGSRGWEEGCWGVPASPPRLRRPVRASESLWVAGPFPPGRAGELSAPASTPVLFFKSGYKEVKRFAG